MTAYMIGKNFIVKNSEIFSECSAKNFAGKFDVVTGTKTPK